MTTLLTLLTGCIIGAGFILAIAMKTERAAREAGRREAYDEARDYWYEAGRRTERDQRAINAAVSADEHASKPRPLLRVMK
jgi:hypothetical protein